jgi:hypothetical protein
MWLVVLGFLFVCLGSLALLRRVFQPSGPLKLQVPEVVALWPGCEKTIPVRRDRGQFRGEVKVAFSAPSGVTLGGPDTISADAEQVDVKVRVAPDAAPGLREVAVEGKAGRSRGEATLRLQIHWVPPGYGPVAEDDLAQEEGPGGARLYRRIVRPHKSSPVAMVLVPAARPPQEGAFYIMEHKLSNGIFRRFAQQVHEAVRGSAWERGGLAGGKDIGSTQDRLPVLRVTRAEAQRCAEWLGGRLPTVRQLDRAGSSTQPPIARRVAVNRRQQGPRAVDDPNGEVSPLGVRDLTGNGREWTRDVLRVEGEELAVLHGRSYTAPPLGPRPDSRSRPELTPTQYPTRASPYTGFRVVIEVPAPSS